MVFGNIRDLKDYSWLEKEVLKCFRYAQEHDLLNYEKGSHVFYWCHDGFVTGSMYADYGKA